MREHPISVSVLVFVDPRDWRWTSRVTSTSAAWACRWPPHSSPQSSLVPPTPRQGLILVYFSAQPKPFWSVSSFVSSLCRSMIHIYTEGTQRVPRNVLKLS